MIKKGQTSTAVLDGSVKHPDADSNVIEAPGYRSSTPVPVAAHSKYFESSAHYEAVARCVVAALRGNRRACVLVTSDPPADPRASFYGP